MSLGTRVGFWDSKTEFQQTHPRPWGGEKKKFGSTLWGKGDHFWGSVRLSGSMRGAHIKGEHQREESRRARVEESSRRSLFGAPFPTGGGPSQLTRKKKKLITREERDRGFRKGSPVTSRRPRPQKERTRNSTIFSSQEGEV